MNQISYENDEKSKSEEEMHEINDNIGILVEDVTEEDVGESNDTSE